MVITTKAKSRWARGAYYCYIFCIAILYCVCFKSKFNLVAKFFEVSRRTQLASKLASE